jgi:hypothetical protein
VAAPATFDASIVVFKLLAEQVSASNASMKVDESVSDRILIVVTLDALLQQPEALQLTYINSKRSDEDLLGNPIII